MQILNTVLIVIGFLALSYYISILQKQIKSQKEILDSQNKMIENLKFYVDIFQPEKIQAFVRMRETTFEDQKNREIEKIKSEVQEKLKKGTDALEIFTKEYLSLLTTAWNAIYYVSPELRKAIIKNAPESVTKGIMVEKMNEFPYYGDDYGNALRRILSEKVSVSDHPKVEIDH